MFDATLAILPYVWLTLNSLFTAALFSVSVAKGLRRRFMLIGALAMALLAIWFALLAITAGPTPIIKRTDIADQLRALAALAGLIWSIWLLLYARSLIVIERRS